MSNGRVDPQDDPEVRRAQTRRLLDAWESPKGWRRWSDVNNTRVGIWYTLTALAFLLYAGVLGLVIRAQLAVPENDLLSAELYNQVFTVHGTVMMFLFAVPIFEAVSILLLPQMLASRDLPFPRLSAYGYWCYLIGGVFVCGSLFFGAAPNSGWFMYPPLATDTEQSGIGADIWLLGLSFVEVAAIAAAVELIVGVLKCRPPGMRINLIPLYAWYVLVVGGMILFAFPPLIAGDILFELQRMLDWPFFDPGRGGDPLLWQHLFWIFGHPEVYIMFLPAIALLAMIVPTFAGRPIVGYTWIVLAAVGTGFLSFGLWVHHMFTTGMPGISLGFFQAASEAVAIPTGIQIFVFIATLLAGRVIYSAPMLFATGALAIFVIGGLTGVMVALVPFDGQVHDTFFIVAHFHYTIVGGVLFPVAAGIYYYFPLVAGRRLSERLAHWVFWLMFVGFNLTFMPMHVLGLEGMPRRVFTYASGLGWEGLNLVATVGAFTLATGILLFLWDALRPRPGAARDPWRAGTLEWLAEVPGRPWGVRSVPIIESRYPLWTQPDFVRHVDEGRFYLPDAEEGRRETLVTSVLDAEPVQCLRVQTPTYIPLLAAAFTGGVFIFSTFHAWWGAGISGALALATILFWLWTGTAEIPEKPVKAVGHGVVLPLSIAGPQSVGWWAMFIMMIGDMTAYFSLVFGYFFYWTIHDDFPPAGGDPGSALLWTGLAALLFAWALTVLARRWNGQGYRGRVRAALAAGALLALAGGGALIAGPWSVRMDPASHVYPATVWVLAIWTAVHVAAGAIMQLYCLARSLVGHLTPTHEVDIWNVALYWHFLGLTAVVTVGVLTLFPLAAGGSP